LSQEVQLEKAKIVPHDENGDEDASKTIEVLFNPNQYSISKGNQFATIAIPGRNNPIIQFIKGDSETLSLELFYDTRTHRNSSDVSTDYINEISDLLQIDPEIHAPPICTFKWGSLHFKGVIEKIDKKFSLFDQYGNPLRGTIGISFKQYHQPEPSLFSPDKTKKRIFVTGDSLWMIAAHEYGDAEKWKIIAKANNLDDPLNIKNQTELIIPSL